MWVKTLFVRECKQVMLRSVLLCLLLCSLSCGSICLFFVGFLLAHDVEMWTHVLESLERAVSDHVTLKHAEATELDAVLHDSMNAPISDVLAFVNTQRLQSWARRCDLYDRTI